MLDHSAQIIFIDEWINKRTRRRNITDDFEDGEYPLKLSSLASIFAFGLRQTERLCPSLREQGPVWVIQNFRGSYMCWICYFRILLFQKAYQLSCKYSLRPWSHLGREHFGFKHIWLLKNTDCKIGWLHVLHSPLRRSTVFFTLGQPGEKFSEGTEKQHLRDIQF